MATQWWEAYPTAGAPGVIQGPPRQPSPQTPAQAQSDELGVQLKRLEISEQERKAREDADKAAALNKGMSEAKAQLRNVIDAAKRANEASKNGWFTTGFGSGIAKRFEATPARDVSGLLSTIGANTAFDRLQEMRTQSPTGGALGSITEKELQLLQDTVAALDQGQSDEQFQRNMDTIIQRYQGVLDKLEGRQPTAEARLPQDQFMAELGRLVQAGDRAAVDQFLASQGASEKVPGQIDAAIKAGGGTVLPPEQASLPKQLLDSTINVGAGLVEGAGSIIDAAAQAAGNVAAIPADWLGFEEVADQWRNPYGIADTVGDQVEVPQDWGGWLARQGGRLAGGVAALPNRLAGSISTSIIGRPPPMPPPPMNALMPKLADDLRARDIGPIVAATGGPVSRAVTTAVAATPTGARPIVEGTRRMVDQGGRALNRIATREGGQGRNAEEAGEIARRGALDWRTSSRTEIAGVYDEAGKAARGATVLPERALQTLNQHIAYFDQVPGGVESANYIRSLAGELAKRRFDGVTVEGVRGMRTVLRDKFFKDGLRGSDIERRVNQVVDSISEDLAASLTEQGKSAAAALFKQADNAWRQRVSMLDETIMPIIGKKGEKSGEQIVQALQSASRGNARKFDRFLQNLPADDAADVRATLINAIGRAKPGGQNAAGDAFSYETFLTNWNQMGQRARKALFSDRDATAMDSLARISEQVRAAGKFTNYSQSGLAAVGGATGYGLWADPVSALTFLGGSYVVGKVLASPGVARSLLRISSAKTPGAAKARIRDFGKLASRNPAAANDVLDLQNRWLAAFEASPAPRAAADDERQ